MSKIGKLVIVIVVVTIFTLSGIKIYTSWQATQSPTKDTIIIGTKLDGEGTEVLDPGHEFKHGDNLTAIISYAFTSLSLANYEASHPRGLTKFDVIYVRSGKMVFSKKWGDAKYTSGFVINLKSIHWRVGQYSADLVRRGRETATDVFSIN